MLRRAIALAIAALAAGPAWSQGYLGISLGQAKYAASCPISISCSSSDIGLKIFAGHRLTPHFSVEVGASDLGTVSANTGESADLNALDLSVLASWPLGNRFSLHGRLGAYYGTMSTVAEAVQVDNATPVAPGAPPIPVAPPPPTAGWMAGHNTDLTYGLGASYEVSDKATVRLEWQRFANLGGGGGQKLDVDLFSLGALFRF